MLVLAVGLYITYQANQETSAANREQQRLTAEGQITDRYTKAVEQLGQPGPEKIAIRLGAIYALERIMRDSALDQPAVVEVLAAFIRVHAPAPKQPVPLDMLRPPVDIQAALAVLTRRDPTRDRPGGRIDLTRTNLVGADLNGVSLVSANLEGANLEVANLIDADLTEAYLFGADLDDANLGDANLTGAALVFVHGINANLNGADLTGAYLRGADLTRASLRGANLTGADLGDANLTGADLARADLDDANLKGANLTDAHSVTSDLVRCALTDDETRLPPGVVPPADVDVLSSEREGCRG